MTGLFMLLGCALTFTGMGIFIYDAATMTVAPPSIEIIVILVLIFGGLLTMVGAMVSEAYR
ncbi:hypothetical protein FDH96_gp091 [Mycobacterium phage Rey]|uniref:Uncharacterized protein n=1 Tax=Mycobacterium phage Rey TaxID=1034115 RepID=G1D5F3_9CAUD|nr:hypothetical protein FDH96_gp091 [Mycobacterium phage Rey]AEK10002.1 hypothetical protein PBI_REY_91 [Mycobacterium phage Rey]